MLRVCTTAFVLAVCLSGSLLAQSVPEGRQPKATKPASGIINLNSASAAELEALPGVGAKVAARIVEYRAKKGPFKRVEDLMNVQGIGEKNFLKLRPQLTIAERVEPAAHR
jgi:competence protein ComEA